MIEKINDLSAVEGWKSRDIFSVRILALLRAYGLSYPFAVFYVQKVENKITALISKLDGDYTISATNEADEEELAQFLLVAGYSSILCDSSLNLFAKYDEGIIMKSDKKMEFSLGDLTVDEFPKLMDLYNFIDYNSQDFKAWYVDISHRIRHGTAKAYTLCKDEMVISSGILSSICDNYSILSAVRTENEFRGMGYGSALVSYICSDVKGTVYLMRDEGMNEEFYKRLGFVDIGKWRMFK